MKNTITFFLAMLCLLHSATSQVVENEQYPISMLTVTGSTPADPAAYVFEEVENGIQGVNIHLPPTELTTLFMQSGNVKLAFNLFTTGLFFTNLEVNYDNTGWTSLYSGSSQQSHGWVDPPASFQTLGSHNLKVRYLNASAGTWKLREYNVVMVPAADEFHRDGLRSVSQNGYQITTGNQLYLYDHPACPDAEPVLVVEGFDPVNTTYPEFYVFRGAYLSERLFELGYKVYILNFNINSQSMAINADVVTSAIEYISSINDDKNVLLVGASMGGIISRYASARAESMESPLPVSGLVTMDAPHQGAYIDPDLQDYLKDESESLAESIIGSTAAKQLLTTNVFDSGGGFRTTFMGTLLGFNSGVGYPVSIPTIGIAHSNSMPNPSSLGSTWLSIGSNNFDNNAASLLAGSYLSEGFTNIDPLSLLSWFPLLGSVSINRTENHPTFVSHVSALDLDGGGNSAMLFDIPSSLPTSFHDFIPDDVVTGLYNRFINFTPETILANKTYNYSSIIGEHIRRDMEVYGTLKVNENGYTGFQDAPLPGSTLADYTLVTNRCDPVVVDVKSGGLFDVGMASDRRSTTIIGTGSTLIIRAGGILRVNGNSSLVIEKNANLIIEDGAIVQLWDGHDTHGDARIVVKGELVVNDDFDFSGNGFFDFFGGHSLTLPGGQFSLTGYNKDTRMIRLQSGAQLTANGDRFEFDNGLIEYLGNGSMISIINQGQLFTEDVIFKNESNAASAIDAYSYDEIYLTSSDFIGFENGSIVAESPSNNGFTHTRIIDCAFENNGHGIILLDIDQAYISGSHFSSQLNGSNGILFHNLDQLSIFDSHLENLYSGIEIWEGISVGRVVISNSVIENNTYGVLSESRTGSINLIARQGTVFEDNDIAIYIAQGWISTTDLDYGLVKLDCASLINNNIGIQGTDLLLQIDAFLNSHTDPQYTRRNQFICDDANDQLLFDLCFQNRPVSSTDPILARGNYWDYTTSEPYKIRHGCNNSNSPNLIDMSFRVQQAPQNCPGIIPPDDTHPLTYCSLGTTLEVRNQYRKFYDEWLSKVALHEYDTTHLWYDKLASIVNVSLNTPSLSNVCKHMINESRTFRNEPVLLLEVNDEAISIIDHSDQISVFPNPFYNQINISGLEGYSEIIIRDALGRIIYHGTSISESHIIETTNWKAGMYFTEIHSDKNEKPSMIKVVKN